MHQQNKPGLKTQATQKASWRVHIGGYLKTPPTLTQCESAASVIGIMPLVFKNIKKSIPHQPWQFMKIHCPMNR
jgi:hypothetical protein